MRLARRVVCEPGRDRAHVVVVSEEVERDGDAYWRRKPLVRQRGLDDLDCAEPATFTLLNFHVKGRDEVGEAVLTKAEHPEREQHDGEGNEEGPGCAGDSVAKAFKGLEAAEDLPCAPSGHSSKSSLRGTQ